MENIYSQGIPLTRNASNTHFSTLSDTHSFIGWNQCMFHYFL